MSKISLKTVNPKNTHAKTITTVHNNLFFKKIGYELTKVRVNPGYELTEVRVD